MERNLFVELTGKIEASRERQISEKTGAELWSIMAKLSDTAGRKILMECVMNPPKNLYAYVHTRICDYTEAVTNHSATRALWNSEIGCMTPTQWNLGLQVISKMMDKCKTAQAIAKGITYQWLCEKLNEGFDGAMKMDIIEGYLRSFNEYLETI